VHVLEKHLGIRTFMHSHNAFMFFKFKVFGRIENSKLCVCLLGLFIFRFRNPIIEGWAAKTSKPPVFEFLSISLFLTLFLNRLHKSIFNSETTHTSRSNYENSTHTHTCTMPTREEFLVACPKLVLRPFSELDFD